MITNKRKSAASLTELILSSEWILNSSDLAAVREDLLQDDLDHSVLSMVSTESEVRALAFLYSKRICAKDRVNGFRRILFPTQYPAPCWRQQWTLAHDRLISLAECPFDFTQPTVPETVPTFAQTAANLNGWADNENAFIFYRDDEVVNSKRDGIVQRVGSTGLGYLHAPVVLQRCLIAKYRQEDGPVEMIDIKQFVSRNLDQNQLWRHFFFHGGNSTEILSCILTPGSDMAIRNLDGINPSLMKKYGPGLMTHFRVHSDFLDENIHVHTGVPTGAYVGDHSMLLIGVKGSGESKMFLVQNWWRNKQFVQVSFTYMEQCTPATYFVRTPQTAIPNQFPLIYGGYAESGGIDAEDSEPRSFFLGGDCDSE